MFSKKQRLNTEEFQTVFEKGKNIRTKDFSLKFINSDKGTPRFAAVVPKKTIKSAVKRHLLKRRFFHALKGSKLKNHNKDFIFLLRDRLLNKKQKELILIINDLHLE